MTSILLLAGTDRPENRENNTLSQQLANAETVANRISETVRATISVLLPDSGDYDAISLDLHPTLSTLDRVEPDSELDSFDAVVTIPPAEDSDGPLHPAVAETLNHFMEMGKTCALCSETTFALRWMLSPDTPGLYKSEHIPSDENLYEHLASQLNQ